MILAVVAGCKPGRIELSYHLNISGLCRSKWHFDPTIYQIVLHDPSYIEKTQIVKSIYLPDEGLSDNILVWIKPATWLTSARVGPRSLCVAVAQ
ncbi:MAG: hypothetical protein MAG451_00902 [Anaerolineales bacterium]|nr:hypothetical protein [Anaerolineales bacterium]